MGDEVRPPSAGQPKLPRAVYYFGATSLANDLASEMVYPLLPAFVGTLGGGALALGVLDGLADAVSAAFKLLSGYLADRPRLRGPLVVAGYGIAAVVRPLIAAAGAAWHVIGLRSVDRLGKGVRTAPRDTMIAAVAPPEIRGRAFGLHRAADHVGAIFGPLLAAGLIATGFTVRSVFWIAVVPGAVAVALAWVAVRVATREEGGGRRIGGTALPVAAADGAPPSFLLPSGGFAPLVIVLALAAFLRAPETLLILRAQDLGIPLKTIPILWAGLHVVRSASSFPGGALADRWGPRRTLAIGWLCYAALAWAFGSAHSTTQAWAIFLAFGVVAGLTESPERKLVAGLAPAGRHGRGFGWYHGSLSAVALPGAALFGWLYQARGAGAAFTLSAAVTAVAVVLLGISSSGSGRPRNAS